MLCLILVADAWLAIVEHVCHLDGLVARRAIVIQHVPAAGVPCGLKIHYFAEVCINWTEFVRQVSNTEVHAPVDLDLVVADISPSLENKRKIL